MAENKKQITWTAAAIPLVAIAEWAVTTSSRVSALEAREVAYEERLDKAEHDPNQHRET